MEIWGCRRGRLVIVASARAKLSVVVLVGRWKGVVDVLGGSLGSLLCLL